VYKGILGSIFDDVYVCVGCGWVSVRVWASLSGRVEGGEGGLGGVRVRDLCMYA